MTRACLPILVLLPFAPVLAQEQTPAAKQQLRVQLAKDATAWFKAGMLISQNIDMGGQQIEMKTDLNWVLNTKVLEVPADAPAVVEFTLAAVRGSMTLPMMGEETFDTTGDEAESDSIGAAMKAVAGTTFKAKVATNGKVTVTDDLGDKLAAAREKASGMASQVLTGVLAPESIQHLVDGVFGRLPDQPVAVGEGWDRNDKAGGNSPVATKVRMQLARMTGDEIEITGAGTVEKAEPGDDKDAKAGGDDAQGMREMLKNMKIENGKVSSSAVWSRKDSMAVRSSSDFSMDMTMPGPMGGDMTVHQKQKLTLERTTAEAAKPKAADKSDKAKGEQPVKGDKQGDKK